MPPRARKSACRSTALPPDDEAFVRLRVVLGVLPIGERTWWRGVKEGRYPKPVKLSPRVDGWRVGEIRALLRSLGTWFFVLAAAVALLCSF
jgi:predicted DNA-binding transcriptional regulator AlpA